MNIRKNTLLLVAGTAFLVTGCGSPASKLVPEFSREERKLVLVEYKGNRITIGSFMDTLQQDAGDSMTLSLHSVKELKDHFLDNVIKPEVVLAEAYRRGFDKIPAVQEKIKNHREALMASQLYKTAVKDNFTLTDDELHAQYEANLSKYQMHPRVEMRHILVADRRTADELLARINKGERIGDLAQKYSKEDYGRKNWGKSGNFPLGQGKYPAALEQVLAGMKVGDVRGPVQTPKGWHIVKLIERIDGKQMPFRKVKPQLRADLAPAHEQARLKTYIDSLSTVYGLTVNEDALQADAAPSDIVAAIGDTNIFLRDVDAALARLYKGAPRTPALRRQALQALISKELMRKESYARGFDRLPVVERLTAARARATLIKYFDETEVDARIRITDEDLKEYYDGKRRRIQVRLFATNEQELCHQIHDALLQGESVASITAVVKERAQTKLITWDRNEQDDRELVEAAFRLSPTNRISDVISVTSPDNGSVTHYVLAYDRLTVAPAKPFNEVRDDMYRELYGRRRRAGREEYYQRLYKDAHVRFYDKNMTFFIQRWIEYLQSSKPQ